MKDNSLQKFTDTVKKVEEILSGQTFTIEQLKALSKEERRLLNDTWTERFNSSSDPEERGRLWGLFEIHAPTILKNDYYENNHRLILASLSNYLNENNTLPSKKELSELTCLSRQTVSKHLKDYKQTEAFKYQQEAFGLLTQSLIGKLYTFACQGDTKAAKLFLEVTGTLNQTGTGARTTNYVQVNNTYFSQERLSQLAPEQLEELEKVIHRLLSK